MSGKVIFKQIGNADKNGNVWKYYQVQLDSGRVGNYNTTQEFAVGETVDFIIGVNKENKFSVSIATKPSKS